MATFEESEPNNTKDQANDLGMLSLGQSIEISGSVNDLENDKYDYYFYRTSEAGIISVNQYDVETNNLVYTDTFDATDINEWFYWAHTTGGRHNYSTTISLSPPLDLEDLPPPPEFPVPSPPPQIPAPDPDLLPPVPPPPPSPSASISLLDTVPQYVWTHGCGPTAAASILAHWDVQGYSNLFKAEGFEDLRLTDNVKNEISSPEHNAKYGRSPSDHKDNEALPNPDNSIADFFHTSEDKYGVNYGWSLNSFSDDVFEGYAHFKGYMFDATIEKFSNFSFDDLKAEIDAGRPVMASVDSAKRDSSKGNGFDFKKADGIQDHSVPIIGYEDGPEGQFFYCYSNWYEDETAKLKKEWHPLDKNNPWGIAELTTVRPVSDPDTTVSTAFAVDEDSSVSDSIFSVSKSDADTGDILVKLVSGPAEGRLTLDADGSFTYEADADAFDTAPPGTEVEQTFTCELSDGNGGTDQATATITVAILDDGETITGTNKRDDLIGTDGGEDIIKGRNAKDTLAGLDGADKLYGGNGNDLLFGGESVDQLFGSRGNDRLFGGQGNDILSGGSGRDRLFGGGGNDQLDGGSARDWLSGGAGRDTLSGGRGVDQFWIEKGGSSDTITDFTIGEDLIRVLGIKQVSTFDDIGITQDRADAVLDFKGAKAVLADVDGGSLDADDFLIA